MRPQRRMTDEHDRQEHYEIENVELFPVALQHFVVKVHEEKGGGNVYQRKNALPFHEPIALLARRVDMGRAADYDEAHNDD